MTTRVGSNDEFARVYVWQLPVRLAHWLIFLSVVVLSVTGFYIGKPFVVVAGEARQHFVMGWMKAVHFYAAWVFALAVLSRVLWMFLGNRYASWRMFFPVEKHRREGFIETVKWYLFLTRRAPFYVGHNPLAGVTYIVLFLVYLLQIASGLGLYAMYAGTGSPFRGLTFFVAWLGGAASARWIHHIGMWLILGFAVHHVYSALLVTVVERNGTIESMFSGGKYFEIGAVRPPGARRA